MATFNSMPHMAGASDAMHHHHHHGMSHPQQPHPQPPQQQQQQQQPADLGLHTFDTDITFDEAILADGGPLPPHLQFTTPTYDFENYAANFEDPFSNYNPSAFEPPPNPDPHHEQASPPVLDEKILAFYDLMTATTVVDDMGKMGDFNMTAELHGMFFVAEDVWGENDAGRPLELTCYRRNLWQCSGHIILPRAISHVIDENGRHVPVVDLSATITAVESIEGKSTEIIQIPWKSSNPQATEESKIIGPPPSISLDTAAGQELDADRVTLPVAWRRLQFKHATANNGRRKGLQQHYVVQISLLANTKAGGEMVKLGEIRSAPVIVRGRSPRNFDSRKDMPVTGDKRMERRNTASSADTVVKNERDVFQASLPKQLPLGTLPQGNEWAAPQPYAQPSQSPHPAKRLALSPTTVAKPPVPAWSKDTTKQGLTKPRQNSSAPINLSLSEDERSSNRSSTEVASPQLGKAQAAAGQVAASSPPEEADPLYEYFPLSVDDWMPPVDAVYRPHVVHHTIVPPEVKTSQVQTKSKRYFTAD